MQRQLADQWALQVLQQIDGSAPFETGLVELKRECNEFDRLARQIAGAANAAQAERLLLLIGVDQNDGIVGTNVFDVGDWYAQLRARFEYGDAPHLAFSNFLLFSGKNVGVMVLDTDNPPYVVGQGKKGSPREVPWRYGSGTGPAGRYELLRLLFQRVASPTIEILKAELRVTGTTHASIAVEMYVYPARSFSELVIPFHRIAVETTDGGDGSTVLSTSISLSPCNSQNSLAKLADTAVVVSGPSRLKLMASAKEGVNLATSAPNAYLQVSFLPVHFESPVQVHVQLSKREHPDCQGYWELPADHEKPLETVEKMLKRLEAAAPKPSRTPFQPLPRPW